MRTALLVMASLIFALSGACFLLLAGFEGGGGAEVTIWGLGFLALAGWIAYNALAPRKAKSRQ